MNRRPDLERRYRRLLAFYPPALRREREDELLTVLMDGATSDQRRPKPADALDLLANGLHARVEYAKRRRRPWATRVVVPVRIAAGTWLLFLGTIVIVVGQSLWGLLFYPVAALHYYLVYRRLRHSGER